MKQWKTQVINDNPTYPFLLVDNWYNKDEEKAVWRELDFLSSIPKDEIDRAETTIVAKDRVTKKPLSNAYRFYIDNLYNRRDMSPIFRAMKKQQTPEFHKLLESGCMPYARSFTSTNKDSTLVSYYEDSDHYKPHFDVFEWTCLIWLVREPIRFSGGDFSFPEPDIDIKLKNNRMIIFPSCYLHSVSPLKFKNKPDEFGYGKYTITHFYYTTPDGRVNENK